MSDADFQTHVLAFMQDISHRLEKIENVLLIPFTASTGTPEPTPERTDGLFRFVRPAVRDVAQYGERDMTSADAEEAFRRSLHGVNWRGDHIADVSYEDAWQEIDALKAGDEALVEVYREANLDPEFAGYALLVGILQPVKHDGISFGINANVRRGYAGATIQSFMDSQMAVMGGPGIG